MSNDDHREITASGHAKGEWHGRAILTWEKVRAIRKEYQDTRVTQRQLAKRWGVSQTTIHRILTNKNWVDPDYDPTGSDD
jgi:DNA-binding XRE family transcriptional regulator